MSNEKHNEPFGDIVKSINSFFHEKPVRGFLQPIDDFLKRPFPFSPINLMIQEQESDHLVTAELPGIKREQIGIDIYDHYLTITIKNSESITEENEQNHFFRKSQTIQQSSRTISLPFIIDENKVKATYKDGLLRIIIKKPQKKILEIE